MKQVAFVLLLFFALLSTAETPLESLVNAERSFSDMSREKGRKAAFVEYFADDSVIFQQKWIPGRKYNMDQPESSGTLIWDPRIADISDNGELGYTTGPWEFRKDQTVAYGYYMSIWKKQKDRSWKVVLDQGINTRGPSTMHKDQPIWAPASGPRPKGGSGTSQIIHQQERAFAQIISDKGLAYAYKEQGAPDFLLYRNGLEPVGGAAALNLLHDSAAPNFMEARQAEATGGLGYAYGEWSRKDDEWKIQKGGFVRLWKERPDGSWKIVLDVSFPAE